MDGLVTVLGGTGFVGRTLIERWPSHDRAGLRLLIHRSRPAWVDSCGGEVRTVELGDVASVRQAIAGSFVVVNLLRPHGDGWFAGVVDRLLPVLSQARLGRYIHCSSIGVYGGVDAAWITEDTPARPRNPHQREHLAGEERVAAASLDGAILRLGAIFGSGGRNLVALGDEMRGAPAWKLIARRALNGARRMHLVSVEKAADAIFFLATAGGDRSRGVFLVTDDEAPENNFAFVQDSFAAAFGRLPLRRVPALPPICLRLALRLARRPEAFPNRRFSSRRLAEAGFTSADGFRARLERYAAELARSGLEAAA